MFFDGRMRKRFARKIVSLIKPVRDVENRKVHFIEPLMLHVILKRGSKKRTK